MGYPQIFWPEIQQWGGASPHSGLKLSSGVERRHIRIPNPTLAFAGSLLKAGRKEGRKGSHHFQYRPSCFKIVHHFCTLATTFTIFIVFHHTSSFSSSILLVLLTFHHVSISVLIIFIVFHHTSSFSSNILLVSLMFHHVSIFCSTVFMIFHNIIPFIACFSGFSHATSCFLITCHPFHSLLIGAHDFSF